MLAVRKTSRVNGAVILAVAVVLARCTRADTCTDKYTFCGFPWEGCRDGYTKRYYGVGFCLAAIVYECSLSFCCPGYTGANCDQGKRLYCSHSHLHLHSHSLIDWRRGRVSGRGAVLEHAERRLILSLQDSLCLPWTRYQCMLKRAVWSQYRLRGQVSTCSWRRCWSSLLVQSWV